MYRVVDLFAGCGGLTLGFHNAGFQVVGAFDNWEPAINVYSKNFSNHKIAKLDLSDPASIKKISDFAPEIIIGGPPCQDFSSAGWRDERLGRADLTVCFAQIVSQIRPQFFVMENVDRIQQSRTLPVAIEIFKKAKYGLTYQLLDASYCGVPQIRKRYFVIGELGGIDNFLSQYLYGLIADHQMTVRDYLDNSLGIQYYYRHPWSYERRAIFSIDEPSPTIRGVNRPIPSGYKGHPNDATPVTADLRPLTTLERSYIQTFPKNFIFEGSKTDLEQMIGNAVPVKLAEYVAKCLKMYCEDSVAIQNAPLCKVGS